jgi:hypothetical protein
MQVRQVKVYQEFTITAGPEEYIPWNSHKNECLNLEPPNFLFLKYSELFFPLCAFINHLGVGNLKKKERKKKKRYSVKKNYIKKWGAEVKNAIMPITSELGSLRQEDGEFKVVIWDIW